MLCVFSQSYVVLVLVAFGSSIDSNWATWVRTCPCVAFLAAVSWKCVCGRAPCPPPCVVLADHAVKHNRLTAGISHHVDCKVSMSCTTPETKSIILPLLLTPCWGNAYIYINIYIYILYVACWLKQHAILAQANMLKLRLDLKGYFG